MPSIQTTLTVLDVSGPFREPREPVLSYDYAVQRPTWSTPHGVRVKVSIPDELEVFRSRLLGSVAGSPGQQLMISHLLSKRISSWKLQVADGEGMLMDRRDVLLSPFVGPLAHLFAKVEALFGAEQTGIRDEVRQRVGV